MTAYNLNNNADDAIVYLPADFIPAPNHVVCARGKSYWEHSGNKRYRAIIAAASQRYSKTSNKLEKSLIVSEIIESIQGENNDFSSLFDVLEYLCDAAAMIARYLLLPECSQYDFPRAHTTWFGEGMKSAGRYTMASSALLLLFKL